MTWHSWNKAEINPLPNSPGVYAIRRNTRWIYVGQSERIRSRVENHYDGSSDLSSCIRKNSPTHVGYEIIHNFYEGSRREQQLIRKNNPIYNQ